MQVTFYMFYHTDLSTDLVKNKQTEKQTSKQTKNLDELLVSHSKRAMIGKIGKCVLLYWKCCHL